MPKPFKSEINCLPNSPSYRHIYGSYKHSDRTNNAIAWQESVVLELLDIDKQPEQQFFIGDEAVTDR